MKKKTSNLIALLALGILAVGVVGLASGGFKDWSAFTKARDNAVSFIGKTTSSEPSSDTGDGIKMSADSLFFYESNDEVTISATVPDSYEDKKVKISVSWDRTIPHSDGDPLDYVSVSDVATNGNVTTAKITCSAEFNGRIAIIGINSKGGSAVIKLKYSVDWSISSILPMTESDEGAAVESWVGQTLGGLPHVPAEMRVSASQTMSRTETEVIYSVSDSGWFFLRFDFMPMTETDVGTAPFDIDWIIGKAVQADPVSLTQQEAQNFLDIFACDGVFETYGGVFDGFENVTTGPNSTRQAHMLYLACSMANSSVPQQTKLKVYDIPLDYPNTIGNQRPNISIVRVP